MYIVEVASRLRMVFRELCEGRQRRVVGLLKDYGGIVCDILVLGPGKEMSELQTGGDGSRPYSKGQRRRKSLLL